MMIVHKLKDRPITWPPMLMAELRAMPVTMPGRANGRMRKNEIASRPKKRNRGRAKAASDPSSNAIDVAPRPAFKDMSSALLPPSVFHLETYQRVFKSSRGHALRRNQLNT